MSISNHVTSIELSKRLKELGAREVEHIIFQLLLDGKIQYENLSMLYVSALKERNRKNREIIAGLATPLLIEKKHWPKSSRLFLETKRLFYLIKSELYNNEGLQKELDALPEESKEFVKRFTKEYEYGNGF